MYRMKDGFSIEKIIIHSLLTANGEIHVPANVLRLDMCDNATYRTTDFVLRGGKLYDKYQTYIYF